MSFLSGAMKLLPNIISGAAGVGAGYFDYHSARAANDANRNMAREQMQFQERMSNSAYQRATEDMKKAGINPMLAYTQGGASSPPGSTAVMQPPASRAIHSGLSAFRAHSELRNLQETNRKIASDVSLNRALEYSAKKDALVKANTARQIAKQTELLNYQVPGHKVEAEIDSGLYGKIARYFQRANPLGHAAKSIAHFLR